jgi:hypothetical protein
MIMDGIVEVFDIGACLSAVGKLFKSRTYVETGTSHYVGLKRLTKLVVSW